MNSKEIKKVVSEFVKDNEEGNINNEISFEDVYDVMGGCLYWTTKRMIAKNMIIKYLKVQCTYLNGKINYDELENCRHILKNKVIMV